MAMTQSLKKHLGILLLILGVVITHTVLAVIPPLISDEAMFWEWSRHLAFGYYAHPPMTGWLIALVTKIFGTSQFTVRLTSILLHIGVIILVYGMAWEITRNKRLALLSAVLYTAMPLSLLLGTAITTDSPLIFFFTAAAWAVRKAIVEEKRGFWYIAAVACGGMLLSKFMAVLFFPGVFFFLLAVKKYRKLLVSKEPYLAFLIALILFSPFIWWNMNNKWLTFQFNLVMRQRTQGLNLLNPAKYIAGQMIAASPVLFAVLIFILVVLVRRSIRLFRAGPGKSEQEESILLLWFIVAFPLLFYVPVSIVAEVGAHYTAIVYPAASVLFVVWCFVSGDSIRQRLAKSKTYWISLSTSILVSLGIFVLTIFPKILPDNLIYTPALLADSPLVSNYFGWHAVGDKIVEIKKDWENRPEGFFLTSKDYGLASLLGFYTPGRPQYYLMNVSKSVIHGKSYLIWERGKKKIGANTLYVSDTPYSYKTRIPGFFKKIIQLPPMIIRDTNGKILRIFYFTIGEHYLGGEPDNLSIW